MGFKRTKEDFTCSTCGAEVVGTGYTNHCPECLWSKHVDIVPGDRREACEGMMEPVRLEGSTPHYRIIHRCEACKAERAVGVDERDAPAAIIALSAKRAAS